MYKFISEQFLKISSEHAWEFFSNPGNLAHITPPEMDFNITTNLQLEDIHENMQIEYTVKPLFGIKVRWITLIGKIEPCHSFTDIQVKGPYKAWRHTHIFVPENGGVTMKDEVLYELPLGLIGKAVHKALVRKKIEYIFAYRRKILDDLFNQINDN